MSASLPRWPWRTIAKLASVSVLLLLAPYAWIPQTVSKSSTLLALDAVESDTTLLTAVYVGTVALAIMAVAGAPFLRSSWIRCPLVIVFLAGYGMNHVAEAVQGEPLSSHMLATFIQARHQYDYALGSYAREFLVGGVLVTFLTLSLLTRPDTRASLGTRFLVVPVAAFSVTGLLMSQLAMLEEFPSPVGVPVKVYFALEESSVYLGPRDPLTYTEPVQPRATTLILIVDEGIRGDYLQINEPNLDNTPFLASELPSLANFGVATSFANCSATARVALRSGARETDFPDPRERILRQPTFWQFAKSAGFRTVYIDTWLSVRRMSSMFTYDEVRYIDEKVDVPLAPYSTVDDRVAERILEELRTGGPALIFVEKSGMHTPYRRNLPADPAYRPRVDAPGPVLDSVRAQSVRDYMTGIWWRVDRFFERLLPAITEPGVLVIYTSDHGQSLYEGGYDGSSCSGANAVKGEGLVPLMVFATDLRTRETFQTAAARSFNRAAHSDIFPTLLWAMGYDPSRVTPPYPPGLLNLPVNRQRRFFVFSPFVDEMQWIPVD